MWRFEVETSICIQCGACCDDCPADILVMQEKGPIMLAAEAERCYRCQHCLAICPTGALSILGRKPEQSQTLHGNFPRPEQLATLIKGRRSVRSYKDEDLEPELIDELLTTAWHAPTGVNSRQVLFTVIDKAEKMRFLRQEVMEGIAALSDQEALPQGMEFFAHFVKIWREEGRDAIFRDAPHLVIASAPQSAPTPLQDCIIALSYFELYSQVQKIGTVWAGLVYWAMESLLPHYRQRLEIPENHRIGYAMLFGKPAIQYERTVQHQPALIRRPSISLQP